MTRCVFTSPMAPRHVLATGEWAIHHDQVGRRQSDRDLTLEFAHPLLDPEPQLLGSLARHGTYPVDSECGDHVLGSWR